MERKEASFGVISFILLVPEIEGNGKYIADKTGIFPLLKL